jgi:hypothetical protein
VQTISQDAEAGCMRVALEMFLICVIPDGEQDKQPSKTIISTLESID